MRVEKSIYVDRPVEVVFKVFTEEIGAWWPLHEGFSFGGDKAAEMYLEGREGGRVFERFTDGEEFDVGVVSAYDPPARVQFTWKQPDWAGASEVDVRFVVEGEGTRVNLTHRGFEATGADVQKMLEDYGGGWEFVLSKFAEGAAA